jgi:hypothetical protein
MGTPERAPGFTFDELEFVEDIEWDDEPYQFRMTKVLRAPDGTYFTADDSGCSCPCPFEDTKWPDDYDGPYTAHQLADELNTAAVGAVESARMAVVSLIAEEMKR